VLRTSIGVNMPYRILPAASFRKSDTSILPSLDFATACWMIRSTASISKRMSVSEGNRVWRGSLVVERQRTSND
jgi:hypothetical protein